MGKILIAGVESVVGCNLAAFASDDHPVIGLSFSQPVAIDGCETAVCHEQNAKTIRKWVAAVEPEVVVHCGLSDVTGWQRTESSRNAIGNADSYACWARVASELGSQFTLLSSDAIFSGPWMFHKEESRSFCDSRQAVAIRAIEKQVQEANPAALIARACAYGWTPYNSTTGWIEQTLARLERRNAGPFDSRHHATPILATDLAAVLMHAWNAGLEGVYHIGGAERVNQLRFAALLAEQFELSAPTHVRTVSLDERPTGFGEGETSLHSTKIRKALGIPAPMLGEGLSRLYDQVDNGHCDRLQTRFAGKREKVA